MPTIRHPQHYPREYFQIVERVTIGGQSVVVPCETPEKARKLRGHFYAFVGALKRHQTEFADAFTQSQRTMVSLEGSNLRFQSRDNAWQAKTVAAALAAEPGKSPQPTPDVFDSLKTFIIQEESK